MNRIALCIPAYNAAEYLPRLLKSAKEQIVPFDQVLVYNDCSKDNTSNVARQLGATVIEGDVNRGCSFGKNRMAEITDCDWIHFHDADDELMPNYTKLAHKWISEVTCPDVVLFNYEYRDNDTNQLIARSNFDNDSLRADAVRYAILNQINPFCGLYRRNKLISVGGYDLDPEILYNEDVAFHCKLAIQGLSFGAETELSIINYRLANSMSAANQVNCARAQFQVMKRNAKVVGAKYADEIAEKLWQIAVFSAYLGDWHNCKSSLKLFKDLRRRAPLNENSFVRFLSFISPEFVISTREQIIRRLKPHLRSHLNFSRTELQ